MPDAPKSEKSVTFPPAKESWLSPERVEYMSHIMQTILFALALPYLFFRFVTNPLGTMRGASLVHAPA